MEEKFCLCDINKIHLKNIHIIHSMVQNQKIKCLVSSLTLERTQNLNKLF